MSTKCLCLLVEARFFFTKIHEKEKSCQSYRRFQVLIFGVVESSVMSTGNNGTERLAAAGNDECRMTNGPAARADWMLNEKKATSPRPSPPKAERVMKSQRRSATSPPAPMASQARHHSVSPQETSASRFVVQAD